MTYEPLKLLSMKLEHFRCFANLELDFDPQLTVLTGKHGSGKTALLDAVSVFLKHLVSPIDDKRVNFRRKDFQTGHPLSVLKYEFLAGEEIKKSTFAFTVKYDSIVCHNDCQEDFQEIEKKNIAPIFACYSEERRVDSYEYKRYPDKGRVSAFENAFSHQIDFSRTLSWFIDNASGEALEGIRQENTEFEFPELTAVHEAVVRCVGRYYEPCVAGAPPRLIFDRKDTTNRFLTPDQLDGGCRTMLALVMDLARRMAVANADSDWGWGGTVLDSPGIVLIDEIELRLHPSWQQTVLPDLMEIFPNVQFIVTTHSPQVAGSLEGKHIRILDNNVVSHVPPGTLGADSSHILKKIFGSESKHPLDLKDELNEYKDLVYSDKWDEPRTIELKNLLYDRYREYEEELFELQLYILGRKLIMEEEEKKKYKQSQKK